MHCRRIWGRLGEVASALSAGASSPLRILSLAEEYKSTPQANGCLRDALLINVLWLY